MYIYNTHINTFSRNVKYIVLDKVIVGVGLSASATIYFLPAIVPSLLSFPVTDA